MQQIHSKKTFPSIEDVLYGRIKIDNDFEYGVISHSFYQRLRRIKQLGFLSYVFPSANHTRFEHGLGAMHLAGLFWDSILKTTEELANKHREEAGFKHKAKETKRIISRLRKDNKIRQLLRAITLIHDLGHGPFSHIFEKSRPTYKEITNEKDFPSEFKPKIDDTKQISHEYFSVMLLRRILQKHPEILNKGLSNQAWNTQDFLRLVCHMLYDDYEHELSEFELTKLANLTHALPNNTLAVMKSLISGILDVDRMDYLYRDSYHAGVKYGIFDRPRLLESVVIWPHDNRIVLAIRQSGVAALEHYLFCLYQMYLQIYSHKTENACNAMLLYLQNLIGKKSFRKYHYDLNEYGALDDNAYIDHCKNAVSRKKETGLFQDLFIKRNLWKRYLQIRIDLHDKSSSEIKQIVRETLEPNNVRYEFFSSTREIAKGLKYKDNDVLVALKRSQMHLPPQHTSLISVSDLIKSYQGKKYEVLRLFSPKKNKKIISEALRKIDSIR